MSFVKVKNLAKSYGKNNIFKNIEFNINKGELITLLGPSGCGKSTLLRCIAGLNDIDEGEISVEGNDIAVLNPKDRNIGMVFQSYALFPNMNVFQNIAFGLKMKKISKNIIQEKVNKIIKLVELEGKENYFPNELSGGQRQRVALARSIIVEPDILLLDEPLSALDAQIRKNLRIQIRRIQKEFNITTIFVTHDQEEALVISDRIFVMNKGKFAQIGTPEEIYTNPQDEFLANFIGNYNVLEEEKVNKIFNGKIKGKSLAIRPESIYIREKNKNYIEENFYKSHAIIHESIILGNVIRYSVNVNGESLTVDLLNRGENKLFNIGSSVELMFIKKEIKILA